MKFSRLWILPIACGVCVAAFGTFAILDASGAIDLTIKKLCKAEFRNYDDSVIWTTEFRADQALVYEGPVPTREPDETKKYTFSNWDKSLENVKEDTIFYAQYFSEKRDIECKFVNFDGTVLYTDQIPYGSKATYIGAAPVKPQDEYGYYDFVGWDKPLEAITHDTVFNAEYALVPTKYHVTFLNYDDKVLFVDEVSYGSDAEYEGIIPIKPSTNRIDYTFSGWDKSITNVVEDFSTYAVFDEEVARYEVDFLNYDGELLYVDYVGNNGTAEYVGSVPYHPSDGTYSYFFSGWNKPLTNIHQDMVITAEFDKKLREYDVIFKNYDGTILQESKASYGEGVEYKGELPSRPSTETTKYIFTGWDRDTDFIVGSIDVYPTWEVIHKDIMCIFQNYDGTYLSTEYVEYGGTVTYFGPTPARVGDRINVWKFIGWDKSLKDLTKNTVFTAQYELVQEGGGAHQLFSSINFINYNGILYDSDVAEVGEKAEYYGPTPVRPAQGDREFYFVHWDKEEYLDSVPEASFNTYAEYVTSYGEYIVTYRSSNGELLFEDFVYEGESSTYGGEDYSFLDPELGFIGWSKDTSYITDSITVYPVYDVAEEEEWGISYEEVI